MRILTVLHDGMLMSIQVRFSADRRLLLVLQSRAYIIKNTLVRPTPMLAVKTVIQLAMTSVHRVNRTISSLYPE